MTLNIENILATVTTKEGFQRLIDSQENVVTDPAQILDDLRSIPGETGIAHNIPELFRNESPCGDYFSPYFVISGFRPAEEWVNEFEDAMAVGLTILKHTKEFIGNGDYFFEIVSERTEEIDDYWNEDEDDDECMEDYAETETHLFRVTLNSDDEIIVEHGRNNPDPQYPALTLTGDPTEFIKKEFSRYA